jgi:hypothetical protein
VLAKPGLTAGFSSLPSSLLSNLLRDFLWQIGTTDQGHIAAYFRRDK